MRLTQRQRFSMNELRFRDRQRGAPLPTDAIGCERGWKAAVRFKTGRLPLAAACDNVSILDQQGYRHGPRSCVSLCRARSRALRVARALSERSDGAGPEGARL